MSRIQLKYLSLIVVGLVLALVLPRVLRGHMPEGISTALAPRCDTRSQLDVHYAPQEDLERIDVDTLRQAHSSIEFYGYSLTDEPVIAALKYAALKGAIVCVYLDNEQTENELRRPDLRSALLDLAATPNVAIRVKRSRVLQHTKAYVIDTRLLREGSANFSRSALMQQDNDLLLTNDDAAIIGFEHSYQLAWGRPDNVPLAQFAQSGE
jgi:phosphatidylserine/phosphatidylglycerophosphate/cardiolipin synthase-like enzyme